jgi:hypothetical protein
MILIDTLTTHDFRTQLGLKCYVIYINDLGSKRS